ncbi:MAG: hypothetical protein Kow00106_07410 [Anaerolineae bacterium]
MAWLALLLVTAAAAVLYLSVSMAVSRDPLLMPLDDTYIHFQYARQWAAGEPFRYYPGDPHSSGATSLLYPLLLAIGYRLGFTGWTLSYWALGIGLLSFVGATWLVYLLGKVSPLWEFGTGQGYALVMAVAFALSGPFVWAALSGMETALFLFSVLLTFYAALCRRVLATVGAAILTVLVRPEGLVVAVPTLTWIAMQVPWPDTRRGRWGRIMVLSLPLWAAFVQPLINWAGTGTLSSSGMQAKSHLANSSIPVAERLNLALSFWWRMVRELFTGYSADWGLFTSPALAPAALTALLGGAWLAWRRQRINGAVAVLACVLALTAAVATLDTAFWQFKRYQLPIMALFYPAAAWLAQAVGDLTTRRSRGWPWHWALPMLIALPALPTLVSFASYYGENLTVVRDQQVPMARWVRDRLPVEGRVAVHDVGLMGYFSNRPLYDVVGLTLPGPAPAWRQGPGAIYEAMAHSPYRPAAFAIYPDVQGLRYLLNAGIFGTLLAEFPVRLPDHNVAAASDYQGVYLADWSTTRVEEQVAQTSTLTALEGFELVDAVDVANLESEEAHNYRWWQAEQPAGFVTEVYTHSYHVCGLADSSLCRATDGGRVLTGGEEFTLRTHPGEDLLLVTRVHGRDSVPLAIYVNGELMAWRVQPAVPGRWLEIVTLVPGEKISGAQSQVRIVADTGQTDAAYLPYYHWAFQGHFVVPTLPDSPPVATFGEQGTIRVREVTLEYTPAGYEGAGQVTVHVTWQGPADDTGDGVAFVHLYNTDNLDTEPLAQVTARPGGGVLPPANWLPGLLSDSYTVSLPQGLKPGTYTVALGLFDARTGERYAVRGQAAGTDRRLFIGTITVEEMGE